MPRWVFPVLAGLLGVAAGLVYGWMLNPVKFVDTTPASLRADYRTDYVLMVAEAFHADHDAGLAARRLGVFGSQPAAAIALAAEDEARSLGYSSNDLQQIQDLRRAMQASQPAGSTPVATP